MRNEDALGLWYCQLVDHEQSDEEAERFGEYDDFDRPPQKARKTEFAQTTLELRDDGSYRIEQPDWATSTGTWAVEGERLAMHEGEDSTNGFDGLEYASLRDDRLVVAFKLIPDAHDGLDILVLSFGRTAPVAKPAKPDNFVDRVLALDDEEAVDDLLDDLDSSDHDPAQLERELWDAWVDGRLLVDPEFYELQLRVLDEDRFREAGGFNHGHAKYALITVDFDEQRDLFDTALNRIASLPVDDEADAGLAPLVKGPWLDRLVIYRFLGGGLPEELYSRRSIPQPAVDDACRAYLLQRSYFTRFEAMDSLFGPGHPDAARVAIRYRGHGLLEVPLAWIDARGIADEALAAALELLAGDEVEGSVELWLNAMMFAVVLSVRAGAEIPAVVVESLGEVRSSMVMGGLSEDEKQRLRDIIRDVPEPIQALIVARYWLG